MRNVHLAETAEAIRAWATEPDTRVCARNVRLSKGHWWFRDTATKYGGAAVGDAAPDSVSPSGARFPESFIRLSGGATTQQISSAGVLETLRGCLVFVRNQVWPGLSGFLFHRPSAISDSGSYPGDSRQPDESQ